MRRPGLAMEVGSVRDVLSIQVNTVAEAGCDGGESQEDGICSNTHAASEKLILLNDS